MTITRDVVPADRTWDAASVFASEADWKAELDALETALTKQEPRPRRKHGNIPL